MYTEHAPLANAQLRRSLCALLLIGCLWLPAANTSAQQQELLQLVVSSGRISQIAATNSPQALSELRSERDAVLRQLEELSKVRPTGKTAERYADQLDRVRQSWQRVASAADRLLELEQVLLTASEDADLVQSAAPAVLARLDQLVQRLADGGATGKLIYIVARQSVILERMQRRIHAVLRGAPASITAADGLQRDFAILGRTQKALSAGDAEIGIAMLEDESSRTLALEINSALTELDAPVQRLVRAAHELSEARDQSEELQLELTEFQRRVVELHASLR